jgi:hypothetical protein
MIELILGGTAVGAVGWGVGFACGFFLELRAHQREREQWMNFHQAGSFELPRARSHTPETPESRIDEASKVAVDWSPQSIDKGIEELRRMYKDEVGVVPSEAELRREAELMLNAAAQGEGEIDA